MPIRVVVALAILGLVIDRSRAADSKGTRAVDAIPAGAASVIVANGPFSARPCSDSARAIDTFRCATLAPLTQLSATIERRLSRDQLAWSLLALSEAWSVDLGSADTPPPDDDSAIVEFPGGLALACIQPEACSVKRLTRGDAAEHGRIGGIETWTMKSAKPGSRLPVLLANPRPGILVAAYSKTFLEEIAQTLSTHNEPSASIPEMRHVRTDSPVWGARHFPAGAGRRNVYWEFDEVDAQILGFAFQVGSDETIDAYWVSPDTRAVDRLSHALEGSGLELAVLDGASDRTRFRIGCLSGPTCDAPYLVLAVLAFPTPI
jgi:hypothetical protein